MCRSYERHIFLLVLAGVEGYLSSTPINKYNSNHSNIHSLKHSQKE